MLMSGDYGFGGGGVVNSFFQWIICEFNGGSWIGKWWKDLETGRQSNIQSMANPQEVFLGECPSQHQMTKIQSHKNNLSPSYPDQIYIDKQYTNDFGWQLCKNMKQTKINF
jgi:hypothetical protein